MIGEGKYNLNVLKEIKVTESFLGLGQDETKCQINEDLDKCRTRHRLDNISSKYGCLPARIWTSNNVCFMFIFLLNH